MKVEPPKNKQRNIKSRFEIDGFKCYALPTELRSQPNIDLLNLLRKGWVPTPMHRNARSA